MNADPITAAHANDISPARSIDDLPGPRAFPFVGNMLQLKPSRIHLDLEKLCARYGDFFRLYIGRRLTLAVADPEQIGKIFGDRPHGFRRPASTSRVLDEMGWRSGVFLAEGAEWRNQRRMVMSAFSPTAVKAYFPSLVKAAIRLQKRWGTAAREKRAIDLCADMKRYTVDIIAGLAFGTEVNTIESGDEVIQRYLENIFPGMARRTMAVIPYWRYVKLPSDRQLERSVAELTATVDELISQARHRMRREPSLREHPRNLLEAMIAAADRPDSDVGDADVAGNVLTMLLAGEDTTANTLAWLVYLLHRNPDCLKQAQEEIRRVAPYTSEFSLEQMDALEYLGACAQEAMRLKPVAPFIAMEALRDTTIAGIDVPAGSLVWCLTRRGSLDERHFDSPLDFDPQRWLNRPEDGKTIDKKIAMPFGSGPRTCPGRYLALLEIKVAMAMLLGRFDIERIDTPDGKKAKEVMGFTMAPDGLSMLLGPHMSLPA